MTGRRSYKGTFKPTNPNKYRGNVNNIVWRSTWELKFMNALDLNPNVVSWASEEITIPYISPVDNKLHRYFPDFFVEFKNSTGKAHKMIVEVKPAYQTQAPKPRKRVSPVMLKEIETWDVNRAKWAAATRFCEDLGWQFKIATEKELEIPG